MSKATNIGVAAGAFALCFLGLVYFLWSRSTVSYARKNGETTVSSFSDNAQQRIATDELVAGAPFASVRAALERRASAGDVRAARQLGLILANCNHYTAASDIDVDKIVDEALRKGSARINGHIPTRDEAVTDLKARVEQKSRECLGVIGLDDERATEEAFEWIQRAAALGDADAQAMYGAVAFLSYDVSTALTNAEEIRERKRLAVDYLQRSLAQGDALALLQLSAHYSAGDLYPADPESAYAYLYAYSLTSRAAEIVPVLLDEMLAGSAQALDDASLERARVRGRQVALCCGAGATGK